MEDIYSAIVIYLIGFSGVGKTAIAKEMVKFTGIKIVDEDIVSDIFFEVINRSVRNRRRILKYTNAIRHIFLDAILDVCRMQQSIIVTDELFIGNDEHQKMFDKVEMMANRRGSIFIPIKLLCNAETLLLRHASKAREKDFKNTDDEIVVKNLRSHTLIDIKHENLLTIDVSAHSAEESARILIRKMEKFLI